MRFYEIISEAEASDSELAGRWSGYEPGDRPFVPNSKKNLQPSSTLWSCWDAIHDILGDRVTTDVDDVTPGMYYAINTSGKPMFRNPGEAYGEGGTIEVPNLDSTAAKDVAIAVHEACHAYADMKAKG